MYRQIPVQNKIINKKIKERDCFIHEMKLQQIQGQVDSKRSDYVQPICQTQNKKKLQILEEKYTEIERENRILLEKITKIMHPNKAAKNQSQESLQLNSISRHYGNFSTIQQQNQKKSLNQQNRRKELMNIMEENKKILERIKTKKSGFDHKKWEEDYKKKEMLVSKISEFPVNLYKKNQTKPYFVKSESNTNPSPTNFETSTRSRRQNYSFDKPTEQNHFKNGALQKRDRSFHLEPLNNSNNIDQKTILYRQSRQFGLDFYIIEISIENGIVADDVKNPFTKVLEMFENDGLKVLNRFFNNNIEEMVQNLKITDKIYIKGLDRYNTEPSESTNEDQFLNDKTQNLYSNKSQNALFYDQESQNNIGDYKPSYSSQNADQYNQSSFYQNKQIDHNIQYNQNNLSPLTNNQRQQINKMQNHSQLYNYQTPNRKILCEITEDNNSNVSNFNTLDSRLGQQQQHDIHASHNVSHFQQQAESQSYHQ